METKVILFIIHLTLGIISGIIYLRYCYKKYEVLTVADAIASLMISDEVIAKYGLTGNNVSVSGFSNGSRPAMLAAYDSLAGNYKTKINSVVQHERLWRL